MSRGRLLMLGKVFKLHFLYASTSFKFSHWRFFNRRIYLAYRVVYRRKSYIKVLSDSTHTVRLIGSEMINDIVTNNKEYIGGSYSINNATKKGRYHYVGRARGSYGLSRRLEVSNTVLHPDFPNKSRDTYYHSRNNYAGVFFARNIFKSYSFQPNLVLLCLLYRQLASVYKLQIWVQRRLFCLYRQQFRNTIIIRTLGAIHIESGFFREPTFCNFTRHDKNFYPTSGIKHRGLLVRRDRKGRLDYTRLMKPVWRRRGRSRKRRRFTTYHFRGSWRKKLTYMKKQRRRGRRYGFKVRRTTRLSKQHRVRPNKKIKRKKRPHLIGHVSKKQEGQKKHTKFYGKRQHSTVKKGAGRNAQVRRVGKVRKPKWAALYGAVVTRFKTKQHAEVSRRKRVRVRTNWSSVEFFKWLQGRYKRRVAKFKSVNTKIKASERAELRALKQRVKRTANEKGSLIQAHYFGRPRVQLVRPQPVVPFLYRTQAEYAIAKTIYRVRTPRKRLNNLVGMLKDAWRRRYKMAMRRRKYKRRLRRQHPRKRMRFRARRPRRRYNSRRERLLDKRRRRRHRARLYRFRRSLKCKPSEARRNEHRVIRFLQQKLKSKRVLKYYQRMRRNRGRYRHNKRRYGTLSSSKARSLKARRSKDFRGGRSSRTVKKQGDLTKISGPASVKAVHNKKH